MNLLADEGVDRQIVEALRQRGHRVDYVIEMQRGITDETVLEVANRMGATLLTTDKDFGELAFRARRLQSAIILLRLAGLTSSARARVVVSALETHGEDLAQGFTVITPTSIRTRRRM